MLDSPTTRTHRGRFGLPRNVSRLGAPTSNSPNEAPVRAGRGRDCVRARNGYIMRGAWRRKRAAGIAEGDVVDVPSKSA